MTCNTFFLIFRSIDLGVNEKYILFFTLFFVMVVSVLGNLFLLATIISKKEMRTPQYLFLANLVTCDLLVGVLCIPVTLASLLKNDWIFNNTSCQFHGAFTSILFVSTILTITGMTIEKYFSLARPVSRYMTSNKAKNYNTGNLVNCLLLWDTPCNRFGSLFVQCYHVYVCCWLSTKR